jgi:hypothetical protein
VLGCDLGDLRGPRDRADGPLLAHGPSRRASAACSSRRILCSS